MKKYSTPLIENFCVWLQEQKKSENTIKTYKRELEKDREWLQEKGTGLHLLKKVDIQSYSYYLESEEKSITTNDKTAGIIITLAKYLGKQELTFRLDDIKPVEKNNDIGTLSIKEYNELLKKVI